MSDIISTYEPNLSNLIKAFNIFLKYGDIDYPTHCEHYEMYINVDPKVVSEEDLKELYTLGFSQEDDYCFKSYRYGSS